jgi:hypothetical protein
MDTAPILTRLWDYGWLYRDTVELSAVASDLELVQQYVTSPAFHTSFLPSDKDETGIHGPFEAGRISAEDYIPLHEADLESYLASIELSETPGADAAERAKLFTHLQGAFAGGRRCYVLRRDERDKELFHEWGFVLCFFREFLFAGSERDRLERFVIGYD